MRTQFRYFRPGLTSLGCRAHPLVTLYLLILTHNMPSEWPNNAYITSAKHVGGGGGSPFHSVKHIRDGVYSPVSKIEVFAEDWKITGIKLSFANGTAGQMHGTRGQYSSQFDLQGLAGELVTKATVWPTEKKDRLCQIALTLVTDADAGSDFELQVSRSTSGCPARAQSANILMNFIGSISRPIGTGSGMAARRIGGHSFHKTSMSEVACLSA